MKNILQTFLALMCLVLSFSLNAQITITASNIGDFYKIDNQWVTVSDTTDATYDIGSLGGGNSWDFTGWSGSFVSGFTIVDPAETPYASDFTNSNLATFIDLSFAGATTESYSFFNLQNDNISILGSASNSDVGGFETTTISTNTPSQVEFTLPLTFGDSWSYTGTERTETTFSGQELPPSESNVRQVNSVDAYGTVTFPDGRSAACLRIKQVETDSSEIVPGFPTVSTVVSYIFMTASGESMIININGADENTPEEGEASGLLSWTGNITISNTEDLKAKGYDLKAPFPNPVLSSSTIDYTLPESTRMELDLVNINGQVVRKLSNGQQAAGDYRLELKKEDLAAGIYLIRLQVEGGALSQRLIIAQ
ncbi:MAG: T9SS type A sorting domain-containing protein [Bacteroidota bacterium]